MTNYNEKDISSCLSYIIDRFGIEVFSVSGRVTALLSDLAPTLTSERVMIDRMSRRGILADFAKVSSCAVPDKERVILKAMVTLIDSEYITPHIAARYIKILVDVFQWGLPVKIPSAVNYSDIVQFDAIQYQRDIQNPIYRAAMIARDDENYDEAFSLFEKAFAQGNMLAGIMLAMLYRDGRGCIRSDEKALQLFMLIHKEKHPFATAWVAEYYRMGKGIPKDTDKAVHHYNSCKDALVEMSICGNPDAQYFLGFNLLYGIWAVEDKKQAFQWLEKSSTVILEARVELAKCYMNGWGCPLDIEKGVHLLNQCAERKSKKARYELGLLYYLGKYVAQDYNKAFVLFEYAAHEDHAKAQYYLGDMYLRGKGIPKDEVKAFEWNKKSARNGNRFGCENLAYQYWNGNGIPKNEKLAFQYFKEAADQGVTSSQYILYHFLCGLVEDKSFVDYELCRKYLERASSNGHAKASRKLAEMYLYEEYGLVDDQKYHKWIEMAAEQGDAIGEMILGTMYQAGFVVKTDYTKAIHWLVKASNKNQVDAFVYLAEIYLAGIEIKSDPIRAFEYLSKAEYLLEDEEASCYHSSAYLRVQIAKLYEEYSRTMTDKQNAFELYCQAWNEGETDALYNLGWMYFVQKYRSNCISIQSEKLIDQLRTEAQNNDSCQIAYLLGLVYYNGYYCDHSNDVLELMWAFDQEKDIRVCPDKAEAEKWWLMAIQKGSHSAYGRLAVYYANDKKDYSMAFRMAEKGYQAGSSEATYYLGQCYARGIGVKKSRSLAKAYFKEAADSGYKDAEKELKKFLF